MSSKPWLSQLFKKRFVGHARTSPHRNRLSVEALEDRVVLKTTAWTGIGGTLPTPDYSWGNTLNWSNGVPTTTDAAGDDVIFPVIDDAARKPLFTIVNNVLVPGGAAPIPNINSLVDAGYIINNLTINDDHYRIDSVATQTLTVRGTITSNIADTLGTLTGLSLIGSIAANGGTPLRLQLTSTQQNLLAVSGTPGVLEISAAFIDAPGIGSGLQKLGTGRIALSGANTFTGQVNVGTGQLDAGGLGALGTSGAATTNGTFVQTGATLGMAGGTQADFLTLAGNGVSVGGTPIGALSGVTRALTVFGNGAINTPIPGTRTYSGGVALNPSASVGGVQSFVISGQISGPGDLTKVGTDTVVLTAANNYSGNTFVSVGTLAVQNNDALSSATNGTRVDVANNATLALTSAGLTIAKPLTITGPGQGTDANGNPFGALRLAAATGNYTGPISLVGDTTFGAGLSNNLTISGVLDDVNGRFNLTKVDQGIITFPAFRDAGNTVPAANGNFQGNTTVQNGQLVVRNPLSLGATSGTGGGGVTVFSGFGPLNVGVTSGSLIIRPFDSSTFTFSKAITLNGSGFNSAGALAIADAAVGATASNVVLDSGVSLASSTSIDIAGSVPNTPSTLRVTGVINSPGAGGATATLTRTGTGTLSLAGNNTYTGQTLLTAGLTIIETATALGAATGQGTVVSDGATLQLAGALALAEGLTLNGAGVTVAGAPQGALQVPAGLSSNSGLITYQGGNPVLVSVAAGGAMTFTNVVSGAAEVRKVGGGTLRYAGTAPNTYNGLTRVNEGALAFAKTAGVAAIAGLITVGDGIGGNNADQLVLEASDQIPEALAQTNAPLLVTVLESGRVLLNGFNETLNGLTLQGGEVDTTSVATPSQLGTLTLVADVLVNAPVVNPATEQSVISGQLALSGARQFNVTDGTPAVDLVVNAAVVGAGSLAKIGGGTMTLTNAGNAYTGATSVTNGVLLLGATGSLPAGTALTITANGLLDLNGTLSSAGSLTGNGTLRTNGGTLGVGLDNTSTVFSGTVTDGTATGGELVKVGAGTLTLTGNSPGFTGTLRVSAGGLQVNANYGNAEVSVNGTLTGTGTVRGIGIDVGGVLAPGTVGTPGTLTATGSIGFVPNVGTFAVDILGTAPGTQYDQLPVTGTAILNNSTLTLNLGSFVSGPGDVFTILTTTSGVSGNFRSPSGQVLTEGAVIFQGGRAFTISYAGNGGRNVTLTVSRAATGSVASSANPSSPGQPVTFTATFAPQLTGDPAPTGSVTFRLGSPTGTQIGAAKNLVNGQATSDPVANLAFGNTTVFAVYSPLDTLGNPTATPAAVQGTPSVVQQVNIGSTTTLTPLNGPSTFGDAVTFVAAVAQALGAPVPTGTVTFVNVTTGQVLGTAALDGAGRAALATAAIRPGTNTIRADYSGDPAYRASSATATQVVDRQNRQVIGSDAGPVATVQVRDSRTGAVLANIQPFDQYTLGVKVATGDVTGDGVADIIVSAGAGAPGGHVKVYDGVTFAERQSFFSFPGFVGGVNVAAGDVDGDGFADVVVGAGAGSNTNGAVKVFSGRDGSVLSSFFSFPGYQGGVTVAAGDMDGDGRAEIIVGSASSAGHVKVFRADSTQLASYFAYGTGYLGGVFVAAGDLDGDGRAEVVTGASNAPHVKALNLAGQERASFFAYTNQDGSPTAFGVRVGTVDRNGDRLADILTGAGGSGPAVKVFSGLNPSQLIESFLAGTGDARSNTTGVFVGGSNR